MSEQKYLAEEAPEELRCTRVCKFALLTYLPDVGLKFCLLLPNKAQSDWDLSVDFGVTEEMKVSQQLQLNPFCLKLFDKTGCTTGNTSLEKPAFI